MPILKIGHRVYVPKIQSHEWWLCYIGTYRYPNLIVNFFVSDRQCNKIAMITQEISISAIENLTPLLVNQCLHFITLPTRITVTDVSATRIDHMLVRFATFRNQSLIRICRASLLWPVILPITCVVSPPFKLNWTISLNTKNPNLWRKNLRNIYWSSGESKMGFNIYRSYWPVF